MDNLFKGRQFDRDIIILCVRWYLRFKLSFRDLVEMMAERGISLAHTTIMRWIARYVPEFEKRWNRFARRVGTSWRVDETYVKIKGKWTYLYRAVDKQGKTVDFLLRAKRDVAAAKAFFRRAFKSQGRLPQKITLDGYQASHRAAREFLEQHQRGARTTIRSSKYLNNLIEPTATISPTQRDLHVLAVDEHGRVNWQKASGYNTRSKVEAAISRYKRVFGDTLKSRHDTRRATEVAIATKSLNRMNQIGRAIFTRIA